MPALIVQTGPNSGHRFQFEAQAIIGRSRERLVDQDDYILLDDREISRQHVRLFQDKGVYYVEDLNSTNGSVLKGLTLQPGVAYPIQNGDELRLGTTILRFEHIGSENFHMPAEPVPEPAALDFDLASRLVSRQSASVKILADQEEQADVSMVVDATRFLEELQGKSAITRAHEVDLVKRMQAMIQVSLALGAVTELDALLAKIMDFLFELFPGGERAFVVAWDKQHRQFHPLILRYRDGREIDEEEKIALSRTITTEVLSNKNALLLMDALGDRHFGLQDSVVDLAIRSVMCAPLLFERDVLGLVQVDTSTRPHQFTQDDLEVLTAISAQIAISMKNSQLYQDIEKLFEGFVSASVQAIEARDPSTAGHSFRVADYTENLAMAVDRSQLSSVRKVSFTRDHLQELRYAALLHDFGKVGVREHVLTKAKRLYPHEIRLLRQRFRYARACLERQVYRELVEQQSREGLDSHAFQLLRQQKEAELAQQVEQLNEFFSAILAANEPESDVKQLTIPLSHIAQYHFTDVHDENLPLLSKFEFAVLENARGSLNPEERKEIESHVSHTFDFLRLIPWTEKFSNVPDIAHAHHEKLDGTGYPLGLRADAIPVQSKIMAIADIYDALTAGDRPYRQGVDSERALNIIDEQVRAGKLDGDLFKIFVEARAYRLKPNK